MEDLRVPTVRLKTEVDYDGELIAGCIFLPSVAWHHAGAPRPEEWINQPLAFFPFLRDGDERARVLNKERVIVMSIPLTPELAIPEEELSYTSLVEVEFEHRRIRGTLLIDMPEGHARVLDYMNRAEPFVPLWSSDTLHLIQKKLIKSIAEVVGA